MNADQFRATVRAMRSAQCEYFRTKSHQALARSKEWERAVDRELQQDERQGKLFDPDAEYEREERAAIQMYGGG
jgi:hypothetical protein